jgi:hypothetical protein
VQESAILNSILAIVLWAIGNVQICDVKTYVPVQANKKPGDPTRVACDNAGLPLLVKQAFQQVRQDVASGAVTASKKELDQALLETPVDLEAFCNNTVKTTWKRFLTRVCWFFFGGEWSESTQGFSTSFWLKNITSFLCPFGVIDGGAVPHRFIFFQNTVKSEDDKELFKTAYAYWTSSMRTSRSEGAITCDDVVGQIEGRAKAMKVWHTYHEIRRKRPLPSHWLTARAYPPLYSPCNPGFNTLPRTLASGRVGRQEEAKGRRRARVFD